MAVYMLMIFKRDMNSDQFGDREKTIEGNILTQEGGAKRKVSDDPIMRNSM
jgi:hypothetical protein